MKKITVLYNGWDPIIDKAIEGIAADHSFLLIGSEYQMTPRLRGLSFTSEKPDLHMIKFQRSVRKFMIEELCFLEREFSINIEK